MKPTNRKEIFFAKACGLDAPAIVPASRDELLLQEIGKEIQRRPEAYEETTVVNEPLNITWDGNTEGLVSVNDTFYKVSDATPTVDDWAFIAKHYEDSAYVAGTIGNMSDNDNIAAFLQKDGIGFAEKKS